MAVNPSVPPVQPRLVSRHTKEMSEIVLARMQAFETLANSSVAEKQPDLLIEQHAYVRESAMILRSYYRDDARDKIISAFEKPFSWSLIVTMLALTVTRHDPIATPIVEVPVQYLVLSASIFALGMAAAPRKIKEAMLLYKMADTIVPHDWFGSVAKPKPRTRVTRRKKGTPPTWAEFTLYIVFPVKAMRDDAIGDLQGEYAEVEKKFGRRRADCLYLIRVVKTLLPIERVQKIVEVIGQFCKWLKPS